MVGANPLGEIADRARPSFGYSVAAFGPESMPHTPGQDRGMLLVRVAVILAAGGRSVAGNDWLVSYLIVSVVDYMRDTLSPWKSRRRNRPKTSSTPSLGPRSPSDDSPPSAAQRDE